MPPNRDRATGLPFPTPVDPGSFTYVCLPVPNHTLYRQALRGVLSDLGKPWTWRMVSGETNEGAYQAAELWRAAIADAVWSSECGEGMSCEDVADCIETNEATRTLIQQIANQVVQPQTVFPPGQPLTPTQANTPLNPIDGCDHDVFWAQCLQFTQYLTQAGLDFIEKIEVYSNAVEAAQFIEMAPVLGSIVDEVQLDQFLEFINWAIETVGEAYAADLTQEAIEGIACAYFCAGFDDCALTIERVWQVHNERLGGVLTPSSIETIGDLVTAVTTILTNPALAVDIWLVTLAGIAKFLGFIGVRGIDQTLAITLKVAVNDASNDWETLCTDCNEPPETRTPVIADTPFGSGGTLSGPDSEGFYTLTWTARPEVPDYLGSIEDVSGRPFKLSEYTFNGGVSECQVFERTLDSSVYVACPGSDQYGAEGTPAINFILFTNDGPNSLTFKMIAP